MLRFAKNILKVYMQPVCISGGFKGAKETVASPYLPLQEVQKG